MAAIRPSSTPSSVLVAVRQEHGVAADRDAGVDGALGGDVAPDLLAGLRLDRVDAAVAEPSDQQPQAVDGGDESAARTRCRTGRPPGFDDVDDFAGALVERDEAMRARRRRTPVGDRRADDDEIAVDDRRHRAATVRGERGELLAERAAPEQLAVAAQRDRLVRRRSGRRCCRSLDRRPARPSAMRCAGTSLWKMLNLYSQTTLPVVGVERHDALLQRRAAARRGSARRRDCPSRPASSGRRRERATGSSPRSVSTC